MWSLVSYGGVGVGVFKHVIRLEITNANTKNQHEHRTENDKGEAKD